ncbi:lipase family protein [Okeania sp. SIO3I5]|uniref:lipase family protein n=1 Tax=Okeania sp. SIO3I5 TaxID=2607805 RepID=UPI0025EFFE0B|nr:lipase family protein [Okeania sp. SIO3I5]
MALKSRSRRDNFMAEIRRKQPIEGYNCPDYLDPIVSDYTRIDPTKPCFTKPEPGDKWSVFQAPQAITNSINTTYIVKMALDPKPEEIFPKNGNNHQNGNDHLYCFEGETGLRNGHGGLKSMMGFVLDKEYQEKSSTGYDIHIVFRGSRSGWVVRAFKEGFFSSKGNPDWVTDTDSIFNMVENTDISKFGKCSHGFSDSIDNIIRQIIASLTNIQQRRNTAPRAIYVTGHSLGGGLAAHFASAVSLGNEYSKIATGVRQMPDILESWPWERLSLITFGAPAVGDKDFAYAFNSKVYARRIVLGLDAITTKRRLKIAKVEHVGGYVHIPSKTDTKNNSDTDTNNSNIDESGIFNDHEPMNIRTKLIQWAQKWEVTPPATLPDVPENPPWQKLDHFENVLDMFQNNNPKSIVQKWLGTNFSQNLRIYLNYLIPTLEKSTSYTVTVGTNTKQETNIRSLNKVKLILSNIAMTPDEKLTKIFEELNKITSKNIGEYLKFCVILDVVYNHNNNQLPNLPNNQTEVNRIMNKI